MEKPFDAKAAAARSLESRESGDARGEAAFQEFKKRVLDVPFKWPPVQKTVKDAKPLDGVDRLYRAVRNLTVRNGDTLLMGVIADFAADAYVDLQAILASLEKKEFAVAEEQLRALLKVEAGPWLSPEQRAYYEEAFRLSQEARKTQEAEQAQRVNQAREFGRSATKPAKG